MPVSDVRKQPVPRNNVRSATSKFEKLFGSLVVYYFFVCRVLAYWPFVYFNYFNTVVPKLPFVA